MPDIQAYANGSVGVGCEYDASFDLLAIKDTIDNLDRPYKSTVDDPYVDAGPYVDQKKWEAGVCVVAGTGKARVQEGICELEVKLPSVGAGALVSAKDLKARAFVQAELASVASSVGPVKAKIGLAADTGVDIRLTGVDVQFLGTGFSLGRRTGFYFFGSEVSVRLW